MEENTEKVPNNISLLDLPQSILDLILKRLSPIELGRVSEVCTFLRDKCQSDHLWENHVKHKWGRVIGDVAYKEWEWHIKVAKEGNLMNQQTNHNGSLGCFSGTWPNLYLGSYLEDSKILNGRWSNNFFMALYFSLESGKFWFPAQVYKGLMIYNALVSYDFESDTFQARYQNGGWRFLAKKVEWDMVRIPTVDFPTDVLYVSDCLDNLKPGDHIEIQWKGSAQNTYDWWYAVIGHLDSCNENENYCQCHCSDKLIVEFKQYSEASNMRRITLSRKNNGEQRDQVGGFGFYGGIRKLHNEDEIETWKKLFSRQIQAHNWEMAPMLHMPPVGAQMQIQLL